MQMPFELINLFHSGDKNFNLGVARESLIGPSIFSTNYKNSSQRATRPSRAMLNARKSLQMP
jgi:hypothetical protein